MTDNNLIYRYKEHLKNISKMNSESIYKTLKQIENFMDYVKSLEIEDYNDLRIDHIKQYIIYLQKTLDNSPKTVNMKLRSIKNFFNFLMNNQHILTSNVTLYVPYIKLEEKDPLVISNSDIKLLTDYMYSEKYTYGFMSITKLSIYMGLTLNEIFNLKVNDVNLTENTIEVKRDSDIYIFPIDKNVKKDITDYLLYRKVNNPLNLNDLFLSAAGTKYSIRSYQLTFKELLIKAGIKENYTPRNLRATYLKSMAKSMPISELKDLTKQKNLKHYYKK